MGALIPKALLFEGVLQLRDKHQESTVITVRQETLIRSCQVIVRENTMHLQFLSAFNASQFHHLHYI